MKVFVALRHWRQRWPPWLNGGWGWAGIVMALYGLAYCVWVIGPVGEAPWRLAVSDLAYLPLSLFATAAAWRLWLNPRLSLCSRRAWGLIGLGVLMAFGGDVVWAVYELAWNVLNPVGTLADVFYIAFYPGVMLGVLAFPYAPITRAERRRLFLDVTLVTVASWMVIWNFMLAPQIAGLTLNLESLLVVAYPLADLVILYGLVVFLFRQPQAAWRSGVGFLIAGMVIYVLADVVFAAQSLNATYVSGSWADNLWAIAYVLFGWAALAYLAQVDGDDARFERPRALRYLWLLPYTMLGLGYGLTFFQFVTTPALSVSVRGLFAGSVILTLVTTARHMLDLLENRRLNNALQAQLQQLQTQGVALNRAQYLASLGTLATGLTHELNNPFMAIITNAGALKRRLAREEWNREACQTIAERIERAAWQGSKIVNALETYVRGGELSLSRSTPARLVRDALDLTQIAPESGIAVKTEMPTTMREIICDHEKIVQVLAHLLKNAREAITPPGTITLGMEATATDGLRIRVSDTGSGMTPEVLAQVFDLFFTTKEVDRGSGLGLPMARGIVQAHGGTIQLTSQVGQGTTVVVELPVEPPPEPQA
jgi:signal transduction histidine kinase